MVLALLVMVEHVLLARINLVLALVLVMLRLVLLVVVVVHMKELQARGVLAMDGGTSSDPYCKVTLGKEKHRSKVGRLDATSLLPRP